MRTTPAIGTVLLLSALSLVGCAASTTPPGNPGAPSATTVYVVRHAERASEIDRDSPLSAAGHARAAALADVLADTGIDAVYASQYLRTRDTAAPLAERLGIEIRVDSVHEAAESSRLLARRILAEHAGETVLIVGHSNTVPMIVRALGGDDIGEMSASDYDGLFTVSVSPDGAVVTVPRTFGASDPTLPPGGDETTARLVASPRHGEWVMIPAGPGDSVRAWVVYPERSDPAPVVVVVHEIFGLTNWIRAVVDQLAADGFIAIAPDLLSGEEVPEGPEGPIPDSARAAIRSLDPAGVQRRLGRVAAYGMALPAARPSYGIVGFCWGGAVSFAHAAHASGLGASVVYYGTSPGAEALESVRAPVLGLYGEDDARVNATVPAADSAMRALGLTFEHEIYPGAGHGFLRAQDGRDGANLSAARAAWPRTTEWLRRHLEP